MIHCSFGHFRPALYLDSLIARLIFRLGAHINHHPLSHLRNLFWTAYVLDKELSIRTGQPPAIRDEDCDLTLPPGYEEQMYTLLSSSDAKNTTIEGPLFPSGLRLLKIKSRVYNTFYQPGSLGKSQTEILISIRELDNDLEKWRLSLPPNHRPTLLISQQLSTDSPIVGMHLVIVRMDYHHCMSIIHQASGRCKATGNNSNTPEGVRSSFALAVETSRSSLLSLQGSLHLLPNGTFWYVLYHEILILPLSLAITNISWSYQALYFLSDISLFDYLFQHRSWTSKRLCSPGFGTSLPGCFSNQKTTPPGSNSKFPCNPPPGTYHRINRASRTCNH